MFITKLKVQQQQHTHNNTQPTNESEIDRVLKDGALVSLHDLEKVQARSTFVMTRKMMKPRQKHDMRVKCEWSYFGSEIYARNDHDVKVIHERSVNALMIIFS